jgi:hypothetical protein
MQVVQPWGGGRFCGLIKFKVKEKLLAKAKSKLLVNRRGGEREV